jgi:CheY-like chemotaxis protein/REP element-mobilizing transposase RayT
MIPLLVVTSDIAFGELIRQNLEETGLFHVRIAGDKRSAFSYAEETEFSLAFLDTCVVEQELLEIGEYIRQINPKIRYVVISEAGWHSALDELSPEDYLSKPFYFPTLMELMDNLFPSPQQPDTAPVSNESGNNPAWLSDVTRAAQHLTRLTLESSAQAALITCDDQLWAYAGQLSQSSTSELAETVSRYWDRQKENDLVRFVHLASTGAEHMLYATRLTRNMVLALIFDAETPFSTIHTQANRLAHSLSTPPSEKQMDVAQPDDEVPSAPISAILSDIPSPNPNVDASAATLKYMRDSSPAASSSATLPLHISRETAQTIPIDELASPEQTEGSIDLEKTIETPAVTRKNRFWKGIVAQDDADATRPNPNSESARRIVLDPVSPGVYNLDYACLLVPRFPHHHLIGDLSDRMPDWLRDTCIAFAWRLEYLAVRPEYLMWNVNVPPSTSPAYLMRIMRQQISEKIFEDFPRFKKENPSGDFWAPGYLIMGGPHPPPVQIIKEFIAQTRQRQGINQPLR